MNPDRKVLFYLLAVMVLWTAQCSLLQNILGLDVLEVITWGGQLTMGHAKHPPLSGWIGLFFNWISGRHDWGMYWAAQLCLITGVWFIYRTGILLFKDSFRAAVAALGVYFLHYYTPSEMRFCTYTVEIALSPVAGWCFFSALEKRKVLYWIGFGVAAGLLILNKYSAGLLLAVFFFLLLCVREYRTCWKTPGPWLAGGVFLLVTAPHLVWLFQHDFVCFRHAGNRLDEHFAWFDPLLTVGATLYPYLTQGTVLALLLLRFPRVRQPVDRSLFRKLLPLSLGPSLVFTLFSFAGKSVILMWFCTLASFSGLAVVSLFPFRIDEAFFRRFCCFLWIFTGIVFFGTTADLLFSSRERLHARPEEIIRMGREEWAANGRTGPVPLTVGGRWYTGVFENYTPERTPACEVTDAVAVQQYRDRMRTDGTLLFFGDEEEIPLFRKIVGNRPFTFRKRWYSYRSLLGKERTTWVITGYLPPDPNPTERAVPAR